MEEMTRLVWHYTTGQKHSLIMESGELQPTTIGVSYPEKGILWFSSNQYWEPTANKGAKIDGAMVTLSMEETRDNGYGLFRYGMRLDRLHPWKKLIKKSRMSKDVASGLEEVGKEQGADPSHWYGKTTVIPLKRIKSIQTMGDDNQWKDISPL